MRRPWRARIGFLVLLLSVTLGCLLREAVLTIRTYGLAQAVQFGNHRRAVEYLTQGANPDILVAYRPDPLRPNLVRYRSLLLLARDRGDASMVLLLKWYGASGSLHASETGASPQSRRRLRVISEMAPDLAPAEQVAQRLEWNNRPRKIDLGAQGSFSRMVSATILQLHLWGGAVSRAN